MDTNTCFIIPLEEQNEAKKLLSDLYDDIDPNVMETEGGGKFPSNFDKSSVTKFGKPSVTKFGKPSVTKFGKPSELENFLREIGFEETISQKQDEIRRSRRLQRLKPLHQGLLGGDGLTEEEEEKKKAIENTQMLTFGIMTAIIIGSLVRPEQAKEIFDYVTHGGEISVDYLSEVLGDLWGSIYKQIHNFGNAYWKQSGNPTICTTGMDTAIDTAMKFPLISGYIGGDGYWKSCATRLAERDDRAMALWALAQKTFVNAAGVVGAGTFIARYGSTFAKEGGMREVIGYAKDDLKSLFTTTQGLAITAVKKPFTITAGFVTDFFTGGMLVSKRLIAGTQVVVKNWNNEPLSTVSVEQLMSVPPKLVTAVDQEGENTSGLPEIDTGINGGKRTRRKRTKSKSKRRGKSKKNRRKKSYKKRNKKH